MSDPTAKQCNFMLKRDRENLVFGERWLECVDARRIHKTNYMFSIEQSQWSTSGTFSRTTEQKIKFYVGEDYY